MFIEKCSQSFVNRKLLLILKILITKSKLKTIRQQMSKEAKTITWSICAAVNIVEHITSGNGNLDRWPKFINSLDLNDFHAYQKKRKKKNFIS